MTKKTGNKNRVTGEIGVAATVDGKRLTLDPIRSLTLNVPAREVESTIPCGLRAEWASGDVAGEPFSLCAGAGFGSRWMTFAYRGKQYCVDAEDVVRAFCAAIARDNAAVAGGE